MTRTHSARLASLALASVVACASRAVAHQDFIMDLSRSGDIQGLPKEYQPAHLGLTKKRDAPPEVTLRLGRSFVALPGCVSELFRRIPRRHMKLSASWYHDPEELPYYLSIELQEKNSKEGFFDGWSLLFNLGSGGLMSLHRVWQIDNGWGQQSAEVKPSQICTPEELRALIPRVVE